MVVRLNWPGFSEQGTLIIPLPAETVSLRKNTIHLPGEAAGREAFTAKQELHITIIGSRLGQVLQLKMLDDNSVYRRLVKAFESIDWTFRISGPIHVLSRFAHGAVEESVILLIHMPGLKEFYQQLKLFKLISADTPVPPAHITLYTRNCAYGISVPSNQVLNSLSRVQLSVNMLDLFAA